MIVSLKIPRPNPVGIAKIRLCRRGNVRLSSVASALRDMLGVGAFAAILRDLAPQSFERLRQKRATPYDILAEMIHEVQKLFPLDTDTLDSIYNNAFEMPDEEDEMGEDYDPDLGAARDIQWSGIPFQTFGFNIGEYDEKSPAKELLILAAGLDEETWGREFCSRVERDCAAILAPFGVLPLDHCRRPHRRGAVSAPFHAPKGRQWIKVWSGVPDALRWVSSSTGYYFLDRNDEIDMDYDRPPWNVDEVRSLAGQWKQARPILDRAHALIQYVDADPQSRLPILRGILSGDPASIRAATRRLPSHVGKRTRDEDLPLPSPAGKRTRDEDLPLPSPAGRRAGDEGES